MIILFLFLIGLCIGSFLNVCIDRLSFEEGIGGRSHCDHCKKRLAPQDLIPVFSWMLLRGKSRCCNKKISFFYPFVEIFTGLAFVFVYYSTISNSFAPAGGLILNLVIASALIVIFFADLKYHIIPDEATIVLVIAGIALIFVRQLFFTYFFGALICCSIFYAFYALSKGRAMGFGDVKYAFAMGLLLGIKSGLLAVYISFVLGGFVSLILLVLRRKRIKSHIAFGPFLVVGTVIMMYFSKNVFHFIKTTLGFA